jgi:hypothetical protein
LICTPSDAFKNRNRNKFSSEHFIKGSSEFSATYWVGGQCFHDKDMERYVC